MNRHISTQERFEIFREANPHLYDRIVMFARRAKDRGKRIGIKCLWELLRWHVYIELDTSEDFKLNNNFTSRYARLIMENERDLDGYFELRELRS